MATDRGVHLPVAAQPSLADLVSLGERAADAGYDRIWAPETWGRDAVTTLATLAARTERVGLGTSVLPVYSRSAALLGQTAATLQEATDGRFRLGLGPSGPAVVERWHGRPFDRPLRRTRETVEVVRRVVRGERLDYVGETVTAEGFRLRFDPPDPPPAVDVAGMGPTAVELAGRFADGWHGLMLTRDGVRDRLADLRRGADLGDRSVPRVTLVVTCAALPDGERARELARHHVAFYCGAMGPFYREALARQGHGDAAERVASAWADGDRTAAAAAVPETLLDALTAAGTPAAARERLDAFAALDGVDEVAVAVPRGANREAVTATVDALAP